MNFKFLYVSDTHLGEPVSLLNSQEGRQHFAAHLDAILGGGDVETLVLGGDIVDQVMSSSKEYEARARAFFEVLLGQTRNLKKIVYLFGNHDLNLFRKLFCGGGGQSKFFVSGVREEANPAVVALKQAVFPPTAVPLFVANPLYVHQTERRVYLFHHGHHIREDLNKIWRLFKAMDLLQIDHGLLDTELEFGKPAPADATTLEEFENGTFPMITTFWRNKKNVSVPKQEQFYTWFHNVSHGFVAARRVDEGVRPYVPSAIPLPEFGRKIITDRYFPALLRSQLLTLPAGKPVSFVYGDTHDVGVHRGDVEGTDLTIYNTGAWISYYKQVHPATAVYAVADDPEETETLWECGFPMGHVESTAPLTTPPAEPKFSMLEKAILKRMVLR